MFKLLYLAEICTLTSAFYDYDDVLTGRQLTTFNRPSRVHIGAKRDSMDNIVRPFHGKITGQLPIDLQHDNRPVVIIGLASGPTFLVL